MSGVFRIDLLDPVTRQKVGDFPISTATRVTRQEGLDRIGKWGFDLSITDPALLDLEGKDFAIYWQNGRGVHFLGECAYLDHQIDLNRTVQVAAAGRLRDLQRQTVTQRSFDGATSDINDVLDVIVPLRAGWALGAVDTVAKPAPLDFWYETIFDSVALLASTFGLHFREGSAPRTLDFGAMGADAGLMAIGGEELALAPEIYTNPDLALISSLSVAYQSSQVVNRLIPFGGAVGVATIDLSEVTSTQAGYPVGSAALPGGGSYYYIEDSASIAQYGLTERRFLRKDLRPISNSPAAREFAANVLYEAALASLLNLKSRQTIYDLSVANWTPGRVRVGDRIRVLYRGAVQTYSGRQIWLDLDRLFYVLEISESFGDGVTASLKINENAVAEETVEDLLASTIRAFEQSQIHVQPTISRDTVGPYSKRISASPAVSPTFSINLGPETLNLAYVKIKLTGEPLKSSVQSVASQSTTSGPSSITSSGPSSSTSSGPSSSTSSGSSSSSTTGSSSESTTDSGSHIHYIQIRPDTGGGNTVKYTGASAYFRSGSVDAVVETTGDAGGGHSHGMGHHHGMNHTHNINHTHEINHTHNVNHTHNITPVITTIYGIYEDSIRPGSLTIQVNGTVVASGINLAGLEYSYTLDITDYILAAATLQQDHTITVSCGSGRGEIIFQAQMVTVIQAIAV
jgi:hypothetical protein